jgi:tetratricopeptide (TPR) repeat protein
LVRQTLYDGLSRARRSWLHIRTAGAIETLDAARAESGQPVAEALAFHYERSERSKQRQRALPYLLQAGQKAAGVYALEIAIDHYQRALALMNDLNLNNHAQRWQVLEQLGWWTLTIANTAQAVSYLEAALALTPTDDWQPTINDRVRLHRLIARTLISAGHTAVAEEHLLVAMETAADSALVSADYAQLLYEVAMWYWHRNEYQEAYEVAQRSLEVATRLGNPEAIGNAYEVLALCCHSLGEWKQGLAYEQQRAALVGSDLDVTVAYDVHL